MDWTITAIKCKTKCPLVLCIICVFCATPQLAVAVVSLVRIVREGKHDADLFIGKRYIQLVNFITELVAQKVNKTRLTASIVLKFYGKKKLLPPCHCWVARPSPSQPKPSFQSKAKCKASDMNTIFYSDEGETHYHKKVLLLASFWKLRFLELGRGLLSNELMMSRFLGFPSNRTILVL